MIWPSNEYDAVIGQRSNAQLRARDRQRNQAQFRATCYRCAHWSLLTAVLFTLLFLTTGDLLLQLLTSLDDVLAQARTFLPWLLLMPLVAVWSYLLDGIFIGATRTAAMQNTMSLAAGLIYLPCWYLTLHWGNHGLWLAFLAFNAARGLLLGACFYRYNQRQSWW